MFTSDYDASFRIHFAYAVAMALTPIDPDPAGDWRNDFGRRGPWGRPLCAVGEQNYTDQACTRDLTRPGLVTRRIFGNYAPPPKARARPRG